MRHCGGARLLFDDNFGRSVKASRTVTESVSPSSTGIYRCIMPKLTRLEGTIWQCLHVWDCCYQRCEPEGLHCRSVAQMMSQHLAVVVVL
jgi:hypothetical protein